MMATKTMSHTAQTDAELVGESLSGNRDAFGQIVARYQSLICSLAYSATGSLSQSEDLAQETFVTAWKQIADLREAGKLRAWLCGIGRNLIHNWLRKQGAEPSYHAEPLEEISESCSVEPLPVERAISREEADILWRSLERIPEIYREPLVLFYREHQSIEAVAASLELSEDAVKQRLSRGRKLLQEQVLAFVEGALEKTAPNKAFTLGVVAALPLLAITAKAATVGATAAQGSAVAKATGLAGFFQALLNVVLPVGTFITLSGWLGYKMGSDAGQSPQQRASVLRFWGILAASLVVFVLLPLLLCVPLMFLFGSKENFLAGMRIWLDIMYAVVATGTALWIWQRRKSRRQEVSGSNPEPRAGAKQFFIWVVVLAIVLAAAFFALGISDSNGNVPRISTTQAQEIIAERSQGAEFFILRFHYHSAVRVANDTYDELWIKYRENGRLSKFIAPPDQATLALLAAKGIDCPTYVQGRDFEVFGWQGKLLMGLCLAILAAGVAVVITIFLKHKSPHPVLTRKTKFAIVATVVLAALIVTPLVWLNHQKNNTVRPNPIRHPNSEAPSTSRSTQTPLPPQQAAEATQVARDFLEAFRNEDWDIVAKFWPSYVPKGRSFNDIFTDQMKALVGGLEIVSMGKPYTEGPNSWILVPYEVRFKGGGTLTNSLRIGKERDGQWHWEGGF
jgi:RNA polymerase sigma factor (sigma-70 family)